MNSRTTLLLFFPILLGFLACEPLQNEEEEFDSSTEALNHKQLPFDMSSFQRAYPDKTFDVKAYKNAFSNAVADYAEKSVVAPTGFDVAWTTQGPGNIGARINTIEIDPNDDDVIYIGYSGGGVFKTEDDGVNWTPIFDDQPFLSIGAIEVNPTNSDIIYVGTGDPNITGYPFIGNGIYKSTDGGDTWFQSGLANTGIISKIIIDPTDDNIIYAATMGNPFATSNDRGLYKSINAGLSWTQILFISGQSGVIDLAINPDDPDIIYASGWDRIRTNEQSIVHGNASRVYRSENGGASWETLTNGLPQKQLSRTNIAISPSNPNVLYASVVDSTYYIQGIYKTTNGGDSWNAVTLGNSDNGLVNPLSNFGWYFGRIFINPTNPDNAYLLGVRLWSTPNSGAVWSVLPPSSGPGAPHVDNHYIAFNSTGDLYLATDGGLYKNPSGTQSWIDMEDIAATQVYRIGYNPHQPDMYFAGCQDNGTTKGNAAGITSWERVFGADGFQPVFHPDNPDTFYFETQNGHIWRTNDAGGFQSYINGIPQTDRKHWDMQYIMSAHDPERLYTGTHRMYRHDATSSPLWIAISGDLTDGNIYGSGFHTISTVHESPVDANILYAGTTDGNVWRSNNYGTSWESINSGLPDRYVTCIKADPNDPNVVYVSHSGYKYNEEIDHLHYSPDQGNTWIDISGNLPQMGINHIEVMPNNNGNVIFVATDAGVYATLDGGTNWDRLGTDFPFITTYDLDLNLANNLLIAGTFGRSVLTFPLDSIGVTLSPAPTANLAGNIKTAYDKMVNEVSVIMTGGENNNTLTNMDGDYGFNAINTGQSITLTPYKDTDYDNGLSSFDIVAMKRHILHIDTLSPYDIIAGDINNSATLSSYDMVLITRLLLGLDDEFEYNNSWRFVRSNYIFPNPMVPFPFPESVSYNPLSINQNDIDFVAVKIGDVNNTVDGSLLLGAQSKSFDGLLKMKIQNQIFRKGDEVKVVLTADDFKDLLGYQFTLKFDENILEFQSADVADLDGIGTQAFGDRYVSEGYLTTNWTNAVPTDFTNDVAVFQLRFFAKADGALKNLIEINSMYTSKEAYRGMTQLLDVAIDWTTEENKDQVLAINDITLRQNAPNPFTKADEITRIEYSLPIATEIQFELFDQYGKLVWTTTQDQIRGDYQIELTSDMFSQSGVYLYQLKTKNGYSCSKRMLYLE